MILYFSGTGNSLAIARAIAEHVGDKVLPLREAVQTDLSQEKRIGFVYPVYNFNAPAIVPKIVAQLTLPKDAYYFIVCPCGAQTGDAIWQVERVLKQKGLTLHYCHKIRVPDNSAIGFGRNPNDQLWKFERFAPRLEQIKADIAACTSRHHFGSRGLAGVIARRPVFSRMVLEALRPKANANKCIGCGICAKVCPVSNIEMVDKCAINGDYRVLLLDEDYQYALVGGSSDDFLWILAREPKLDEAAKSLILTESQRRGYDTSKLLWMY